MVVFDGTEGGPITLDQGSAMTKEYRRLNPNATIAHFFGKQRINALLNQTGCMGIRMYYGVNVVSGEKELILVGVKSDGNDMTQMVMDMSHRCPKDCSAANSLNSDNV
jgi:hypothetical protein